MDELALWSFARQVLGVGGSSLQDSAHSQAQPSWGRLVHRAIPAIPHQSPPAPGTDKHVTRSPARQHLLSLDLWLLDQGLRQKQHYRHSPIPLDTAPVEEITSGVMFSPSHGRITLKRKIHPHPCHSWGSTVQWTKRCVGGITLSLLPCHWLA